MNQELPDVQAGFRKRKRNWRSNCNICWIIEKAREFQKGIYLCFIYYAKFFDCVDHNKLWKALKEMGIPDHLTCLPTLPVSWLLYASQEATLRTLYGTTDWFKIKKGVWQGCLLSPFMFNLYVECIMNGCGSWTIKKAEHWRIDALEL